MNGFQFFAAVILGVGFLVFIMYKVYLAYFGECAECEADQAKPVVNNKPSPAPAATAATKSVPDATVNHGDDD